MRRTRTQTGALIAKLVGARLRELRNEAELSQQDIMNLTGIHRPIVARIERGKHEPTFEVVQCFAKALGLDAADVLVCLDEHWGEVCRLIKKEAA